MDFAQAQILPGLWLDSRRAAFLQPQRILALADLHLGYAWAHRYNGQLLPLENADPWAGRLASLCDTYQPEKIALLGDVVHQAVPLPALQDELAEFAGRFSPRAELLLLLGNHDRHLAGLSLPSAFQVLTCHRSRQVLLCHGDAEIPGETPDLVIIGHEHPAISLGDGVTTSAKFPCFLISPRLIVLPAFSTWVAGTSFGSYPLISPLARKARFQRALAIMGTRLLPIPLS